MWNFTTPHRSDTTHHVAKPLLYGTSHDYTLARLDVTALYQRHTHPNCTTPLLCRNYDTNCINPQWERKVYYSNSSSTSPEFSEAMYASNASLNALPSFVVTPRILLVLPPITVLPSSASSSQRKRPFLPEPLH